MSATTAAASSSRSRRGEIHPERRVPRKSSNGKIGSSGPRAPAPPPPARRRRVRDERREEPEAPVGGRRGRRTPAPPRSRPGHAAHAAVALPVHVRLDRHLDVVEGFVRVRLKKSDPAAGAGTGSSPGTTAQVVDVVQREEADDCVEAAEEVGRRLDTSATCSGTPRRPPGTHAAARAGRAKGRAPRRRCRARRAAACTGPCRSRPRHALSGPEAADRPGRPCGAAGTASCSAPSPACPARSPQLVRLCSSRASASARPPASFSRPQGRRCRASSSRPPGDRSPAEPQAPQRRVARPTFRRGASSTGTDSIGALAQPIMATRDGPRRNCIATSVSTTGRSTTTKDARIRRHPGKAGERLLVEPRRQEPARDSYWPRVRRRPRGALFRPASSSRGIASGGSCRSRRAPPPSGPGHGRARRAPPRAARRSPAGRRARPSSRRHAPRHARAGGQRRRPGPARTSARRPRANDDAPAELRNRGRRPVERHDDAHVRRAHQTLPHRRSGTRPANHATSPPARHRDRSSAASRAPLGPCRVGDPGAPVPRSRLLPSEPHIELEARDGGERPTSSPFVVNRPLPRLKTARRPPTRGRRQTPLDDVADEDVVPSARRR